MKIELGYLFICSILIVSLLPFGMAKTDIFCTKTIIMTSPNETGCSGSFRVDHPCLKAYDNDWSTYAIPTNAPDTNKDANISMNYTISNNSISTCGYITNINYTFNTYSNSPASLRIFVYNFTDNTFSMQYNESVGSSTITQNITLTNNLTSFLNGNIINVKPSTGIITTDISYYASFYEGNLTYETSGFNFSSSLSANPNNSVSGQIVNFTLQLNSSDQFFNISANLTFNGTVYPFDSYVNSSSQINFTKNLTMPIVSSATNIMYNFTYLINGYTNVTDDAFITVNPLGVNLGTKCTDGLSIAYNFSLYDEINQTPLSNDVDYNIKYGITNNTEYLLYGNLSNVYSFVFCINSSIYNNYSIGYGEINYHRTNYATRNYYLFNGQRATNISSNIYLYNIESSIPTVFQFTAVDNLLNYYVENYLALLRWYPSNNSYKIVEMGKTNTLGTVTMNPVINSVSYRVALYSSTGQLIRLDNPTEMFCTSTPCTYTLTVNPLSTDYTSIYGVQGSIINNNGLITYSFNDPSQLTSNMVLYVYKDNGYSETTICNNSVNNYIGILTCNITGNTGMIVAKAYRSASPANVIASLTVNIRQIITRSIGYFGQFAISLILAFVAIWSPIAAIFLSIIGLLFAFSMGLITFPIFIMFFVIGGIIIHFIGRSHGK